MTSAHVRPLARRPAAAASTLSWVPLAALAALAATSAALAAGAASQPLSAETLFTGVFSSGNDAYLLWALPGWQELQEKSRQAGKQGLRVVALRTYLQAGRRFYAGAWREGTVGEELATGLDAAGFLARNRELAKRGLQLVDLDTA
jgi:hypothetical protein